MHALKALIVGLSEFVVVAAALLAGGAWLVRLLVSWLLVGIEATRAGIQDARDAREARKELHK